jgi:CheY-like chemotaxis protein
LIGARIALRSRPGEGCVFTVALPPAGTSAATARAHEVERRVGGNAAPAATAGEGREVLIVDDEREVRDALSTLLTTLGWRVAAVAGGDEALAVCRDGFVPRAVVVDYRLRDGTSGLDVLADLRAHGCQAPAWMVTGDTEPARIAAARAAGVPVIYKPVDGLRLAWAINAGLAS